MPTRSLGSLDSNTPSPATNNTVPAPLVLRFINWIIDKLLSYSLAVLAVLLTTIILKKVFDINLQGLGEWAFYTCGSLFAIFCYYFILEYFTGRTFGKALTGTQVLTENENFPAAGNLALRTIGRAIPFDEFVIFFNKGHTLHDSISTTKVVRSRLVGSRQRKRGKVMPIFAVLLLLPLAVLFGWIGYEQISGGHRIKLSQNIPSDLKLTSYEKVSTEDHTFYALVYHGDSRTVHINQMIAGYDFDPDESCTYMTPTKKVSVTMDHMDPALACTSMSTSDSHVKAYKVTLTGNPLVLGSQIPDYILSDPPYRYAIKATEGTLTDEEILAMTKDFKTYTSTELTNIADSN